MLIGKMPKMNFPKFEGDNPKLWKSRCENYFEMYDADASVWVKVTAMHFEGPTARWLQSVEYHIRTATWSELCSWIHERFGCDQHELFLIQLYKIKQVGLVQDYIDKLCELVDQLQAYSPNVDSLLYTTRFIVGLAHNIKYFISIQRPKDLDTDCCLALLQEETWSFQSKNLKPLEGGCSARAPFKGAFLLPRPPVQVKPEPNYDDKVKAVVQKQQSVEDKVNALVAYRITKGLCRKCGDKWHKGHKCADSIQLNVLQEI
jgi:hypothetical protein